jgi:hypothetical protein
MYKQQRNDLWRTAILSFASITEKKINFWYTLEVIKAADGWDGIQTTKVAANMLNKQRRTIKKG